MLISSDQKGKCKEKTTGIMRSDQKSAANHRAQLNSAQGCFQDGLQILVQLEATEQAPSSVRHGSSAAVNGTLRMYVA